MTGKQDAVYKTPNDPPKLAILHELLFRFSLIVFSNSVKTSCDIGYVCSGAGYSRLLTSVLYCWIPFIASSQTLPNCLTNLGRKRPGGKLPSISTWTRTWPEQPLPAPMPIVGMR